MVDVDALWKIVLAALAAGVGGVGALLLVVAGTTRIERGRERWREGALASSVSGWALTAVGIALVAGLLAMTHK
jgi:putative copper export protein